MSNQEETDFKVEQKVTNTVGAEVYRDVKRFIKFFLKGIFAIVVIFIVYISYSDFVHEKQHSLNSISKER